MATLEYMIKGGGGKGSFDRYLLRKKISVRVTGISKTPHAVCKIKKKLKADQSENRSLSKNSVCSDQERSYPGRMSKISKGGG